MPCSQLKVNGRFGRIYRLHLHGRKNNLTKKPAGRLRQYVLPKRRFTHNGPQGVIFQKMLLFITLNHTQNYESTTEETERGEMGRRKKGSKLEDEQKGIFKRTRKSDEMNNTLFTPQSKNALRNG
jgi:hypothetical protein